jgi:hypothetical protein
LGGLVGLFTNRLAKSTDALSLGGLEQSSQTEFTSNISNIAGFWLKFWEDFGMFGRITSFFEKYLGDARAGTRVDFPEMVRIEPIEPQSSQHWRWNLLPVGKSMTYFSLQKMRPILPIIDGNLMLR